MISNFPCQEEKMIQLKDIVCFDDPAENEKIGRFIRVKGWVISENQRRIKLFIDNIPLGEILPFIYRSDVRATHPNMKISEPIGFDQVFTLPKLSTGFHTIFLKSISCRPIVENFFVQIKKSAPWLELFPLNLIERVGVRENRYIKSIYSHRINHHPRYDNIIRGIGIEMSRMCNFHCTMCPAHFEKSQYIKKKLIADDALIDRVIPFLENFSYTIRNIEAGATWGEPLMNERYFLNNEKVMNTCPNASLIITTNGSLLTSMNIEKILNAEYIKRIAISVDAGNKETYEKIRKGGKWDTLLHNLSNLIEKKKQLKLNRPIIHTNFVIMKSNFKELPQYVKTMGKLGVDIIGIVNAHNCYSSDSGEGIFDLPSKINNLSTERELVLREAKSIKLSENTVLNLPSFKPKKKSAECSFFGASRMIIGIEGEVYPCCVIQSLDYEGNEEVKPMGNVFDEELESIWKKERFLNFRLKMLRGQSPSPICINCPFFYNM